MTRPLAAILVVMFGPVVALAHEVRPAYLELRQTGSSTYDVLWKVPARGADLRLALAPALPATCVKASVPRAAFVANAFTEWWSITCTGGLTGGTIGVDGLSATLTDALVRLERLDGTIQMARLTPAEPSFVVEASPTIVAVIAAYLPLGVEHILTGVDHLLFVLGLLLLVQGVGRLVTTITAFTLSHSFTLTLAALGVVHVPPAPVEALIALSILFVACEIVKTPVGAGTLARRYPWLVAFGFGLLHGLGFAGGLSEAGLPERHIPLALLFFSLGVEIGHFSFVALVLAARASIRRLTLSRPSWVRATPAYVIGGIAAFWLIQRVSAF